MLGETEKRDTGVALSLRYCGLTELPESLSQVSELQCLDVTGNQLTELPGWLGNLQRLKKLLMHVYLLLSYFPTSSVSSQTAFPVLVLIEYPRGNASPAPSQDISEQSPPELVGY